MKRPTESYGFGGENLADPQRGELVFTLEPAGGPAVPLFTQATTKLVVHPASDAARDSLFHSQILSLVRLPADGVPLGTHPIKVEHVHPGGVDQLDYHGSLTVVSGTGTHNPLEAWVCTPFAPCGWGDQTSSLPVITPKPELVIRLSDSVWAAQISVSYQPNVIDLVDAFESITNRVNNRALVWLDDADTGSASIHAAASSAQFNSVSLVFDLDDTTPPIVPLDPADVTLSVVGAWDQDGNPVSGITASVWGIF